MLAQDNVACNKGYDGLTIPYAGVHLRYTKYNTMTTRFVGVKEFRQNMAQLSARARRNNERLIILRKNEMLFELRPLSGAGMHLEELMRDVDEARNDVRRGKIYTADQVRKKLGL